MCYSDDDMPLAENTRQNWMIAALIAVVFGGVAGWITSSATIIPSLQQVQELVRQTARSSNQVVTSTAVQIIPIRSSVDEESSLPEALRSGRSTPTLLVFRATPQGAEAPVFAQEGIAPAIALTADGWLVVPTSALPATVRLADLTIGWQRVLYPLTKGVRDLASGLTFLKIEAQNLPVAALVSRVEIELGQSVWSETSPNQYTQNAVLRIGSSANPAIPLVSDQWNQKFILTNASLPFVSAVWDGRGRLVGISESSSGTKSVIPADAIRSGLTSLLKTGDIRRPTLGVRSIDLANVYLPKSAKPLPSKGAWLIGDKKGNLLAISSTSTAAKLLREGDVIERIDNDILDGTWTLSERVLEYRPGSEVTVTGLREGKTFQAQVTFGTAVTSEPLK